MPVKLLCFSSAILLLQVINHMAAQTMILNQDRCTKVGAAHVYRHTVQARHTTLLLFVPSSHMCCISAYQRTKQAT